MIIKIYRLNNDFFCALEIPMELILKHHMTWDFFQIETNYSFIVGSREIKKLIEFYF